MGLTNGKNVLLSIGRLMNKLSPNTYFSGALAFLPIASMLPFLFIDFLADSSTLENYSFPNFLYYFAMFHLLVSIYFLIYSLRAKTVPKDKKVLWVILILLLGFLVFPFFWYWYVLKPEKDNYQYS